MKKLIPQPIKNIYHLFQAILANVWFGFPSRKMKVIGVTGTNGKTTTCQMISKILEEAGFKVAMASTINFKIGKKEWVNDTKFTTFSSWRLQKFLREAAEAGCDYVVIEVTSHALDQNRVWGISFLVAVLTNVTREHLDYHKTMGRYAEAKEKLFAIVAKNPNGVSVVDLESEFAGDFLEYPAKEKYGYAAKNPKSKIQMSNKIQNPNVETVFAEEIELNVNNSKFKISAQGGSASGGQNSKFFLNLPGKFNAENALAATCVGLSQNITLPKISEALSKIKGVPGRMERIENNRGLEIIVDYAVTPDSLEKLYSHISGARKENGKIIAVFGSCGERDRGKRPLMGKIVARYADYCLVTNEDPYGEDPVQIIDEVFSGVVKKDFDKSMPTYQGSTFSFPDYSSGNSSRSNLSDKKTEGVNAFRILDRKEAIKKALALAGPGDIVVVTGKGAEETMAIGARRIPWNDPRVIREVLQELR